MRVIKVSKLCFEQDKIIINGDVTFETVASLYQSIVAHITLIASGVGPEAAVDSDSSADVLVFDFSGVKTVNSAALALMIEASKFSSSIQRKISFQNLPHKLTSLAQVCGVDVMLSLT